ncbi:Squamous cell carcinoma antigen recognized by T-cells 3 [Nymphon striatum]|nr:Squamous cell carcinoma antigen recognized by T-cells 3 [Nymphon striatum]
MENLETEEMESEEQESKKSPDLSDSDNDVSSDEGAQEEEIQQKEKAIESSPYNYDLHIQLINLLRKDGDLEKLQKARENMNKIFPLSPELWLEWLSDESKFAESNETKQAVIDLFNRAVKEYTSVDIWLEFCQFSIGKLGEPDGTEAIRNIYERAITAVGIHFKRGSLVWESYREFENAVHSMMQVIAPAPGGVPNSENQKLIDDQVKRIASIFKRQLSIPHQSIEQTYEEYVEWETKEINENVRSSYEIALKKTKDRSAFEDNLESSEKPHLNEYLEYIKFEEKEGEPAKIQSLYERAIIDNCLLPDLWSQYCNFINKKLKIADISIPIHERSVRNCPWSFNLWIIYIQALERYKRPCEDVQSLFDRTLQAGLSLADEYRQLWLTYLEYCARQVDWCKKEHNDQLFLLRKTFQKAIDFLSENYPNEGDPYCTIQQYWARLEARHLNNMGKARKIWTDIMSYGNGKYAQMWLEYYNLERSFGDPEHERKVLQMGVQCASDSPETIVDMFLMFEKDFGTLEQLDAAVTRCEAQMLRVTERRAKIAEKESEQRRSVVEHRKQTKSTKSNNRTAKFETKKKDLIFVKEGNSVPAEEGGGNKFKKPVVPTSKENPMKRPPPPGFEKQRSKHEPVNKKPKFETAADKSTEHVHDPLADERTVFLSNLAFSLKEDLIKDIFKPIGTITDLRIVKDFRGNSKGYGYLEFENQSEAEEALKKDRHVLNGRPIYVSRCKSNKKGPEKFKYETSIEKNKIFIQRLNFDTTSEDLKEYFKQFGKLKENGVRVVTFKSGTSKGLAFIEYEDDASAAAAVLKADGAILQNAQISVAISNPPSRNDRQGQGQGAGDAPSTSKKFLGNSKAFGSRGRGRTNLSMVPRSVPSAKKTANVSNVSSLSAKLMEMAENGSAKESEEPKVKMSNEDFRNMLLKK